MERVDADDHESTVPGTGVARCVLARALGTTDVAINRYRIPPGEGLPAGLHAHRDQEEAFVVLEGTATFEALVPPDVGDGGDDGGTAGDGSANGEGGAPESGEGDVRETEEGGDRRPRSEWEAREATVGAGEAIRFAPGEFQSGRNGGDGELVVLALGAPRESTDVRIPVACRDCGLPDLRVETGGEELTFSCPGCGTVAVPSDCPECGHHDLRVTLADGGATVTVCHGCDAEFDRPPLRD